MGGSLTPVWTCVPQLGGEAVGGPQFSAEPVHGSPRGNVQLCLILRGELSAMHTAQGIHCNLMEEQLEQEQ